MNRNEYEDCSYCGGKVVEKPMTKDCWWGEQLVALINDVPTGVCTQCGERFYKAGILKKVEKIIENREKMTSVEIPVGEFDQE